MRFLTRSLLTIAPSLALAVIVTPARAQTVTVTAPNTVNPSGQPTTVGKTFIVNPDGSIATLTGGGGGGGGDASAANQTTQIARATTLANTVSAKGATAPTTAQAIAGFDPAGLARGFATGANGGLLPGQAAPVTPAPVAITVSTATPIDIARPTRIGLTIQTETAPTAIVYLCLAGQTNCSATVHDMVIPSGSGIGTLFTPLFAPTGAIYAFSTAAVTLTPSSWIAQ